MHIQLLPESLIELNKELATGLHPRLEKQLAEISGDDSGFIERFATIAAYCSVALDGLYSSDQMIAMVGVVFLPRLINLRENPNPVIHVH